MTCEMRIEQAVALLRQEGWTVLPPLGEKPPAPAAGQTWVSTKPGVKPRTIVEIGPHRSYRSRACIHFTLPGEKPRPWGHRALRPESWDAWVRKSGARPSV